MTNDGNEVLIVIRDGTVDAVHASRNVRIVVVEPDVAEGGLVDRIWEPIVFGLDDLHLPHELAADARKRLYGHKTA